jgi:prophage maintenance system killer protein
VTAKVVVPTVQDIEEVCYPIACQVFSDPDYSMPVLKWLDRSKMESALGAIQNSYYTTVPELGAALIYYINKNHPLWEGNKRMSVIVLFSFLVVNGYIQRPSVTKDKTVEFVETIAASHRDEKDVVMAVATRWIEHNFRRRRGR